MPKTNDKVEPSLLAHMVRGSLWTIGLRWSVRLTGLVSTVILARLLTPADYGIVAMSMLIVGLIEIFSQTGQRNAIIRHQNPTREHYDSAWTMQLLIGVGLGLIILAVSPLGAAYFHEPRALSVIHVLAFRSMILGFENIGTLNFQRDFKFHKQFRYNVSATLISFITTVCFAFILRNYWALVIGIMTKQICIVLLSYMMEPYRPRFSFSKVREIWSFSVWTMVRDVGFYLNTQVDKFAIGGFGGAAAMGRYDVALDTATSPVRELNYPMIAVLFPVMARVHGDKAKRRKIYLSTLYWSALISVSTCIGMSLVSNDLVDVVFGAKWHDVKPLMPWLALAFGLLGLSSSVYSAFDTIGQPETSARLQWTRLVGLSLCIFPVAYLQHNLLDIAVTRFLVSVVLTPMLFVALGRALELPVKDFLVTIWRPIAAGLAMAAVVLSINAAISFMGPLRLLLDILTGAMIYAVALMFLWFVCGRPDGPEGLAWNFLSVVITGAGAPVKVPSDSSSLLSDEPEEKS